MSTKSKSRKLSLTGRNTPQNVPGRIVPPTYQPISKANVKRFGDIVPSGDEFHRKFTDMYDQTIYIVNIDPIFSDQYKDGYRVYFKDMPNEQDTYNATCFGTYVVPQLKRLYDVTHNGGKLLPNTCVQTVIRQAGNTYRFE